QPHRHERKSPQHRNKTLQRQNPRRQIRRNLHQVQHHKNQRIRRRQRHHRQLSPHQVQRQRWPTRMGGTRKKPRQQTRQRPRPATPLRPIHHDLLPSTRNSRQHRSQHRRTTNQPPHQLRRRHRHQI